MTRVELLEYALEGATTRRGVWMGQLGDDELEELERDIASIERKLDRARYREAVKTNAVQFANLVKSVDCYDDPPGSEPHRVKL